MKKENLVNELENGQLYCETRGRILSYGDVSTHTCFDLSEHDKYCPFLKIKDNNEIVTRK